MFTKADKFLITLLLCLAAAGIFYELSFMQGTAKMLEVNAGGHKRLYRLDRDDVIAVDGVTGGLTIEIKQGKARVQQALCPDHICERVGWISQAPQRIICVPNKVIVAVVAEKTDVDVIIQ